MPLSKRRRLFTPKKHKAKPNSSKDQDSKEDEVATARGRLKGALRDMLEPTAEDSDGSSDYTPTTRVSHEQEESSDEESKRKSQRQSYVLKLFDRSVDLSQFNEDSPLYPICRAWIVNQPKANYNEIGSKTTLEDYQIQDSVDLPGPEGPPIPKIPDLIPEQKACSKNNINLNYQEAPPPSKEQLLHEHMTRWSNIRTAWQEHAALVETRYNATQEVLNKINVNAL